MKRHGCLFEKIIELDNIFLAYRKARKGKSWQNTISRFDDDLDENIFNIRDSLIEKTFTSIRQEAPSLQGGVVDFELEGKQHITFTTEGRRGRESPGVYAGDESCPLLYAIKLYIP